MIQTVFPNKFGAEDDKCRQHYTQKLKTDPCCKKKTNSHNSQVFAEDDDPL